MNNISLWQNRFANTPCGESPIDRVLGGIGEQTISKQVSDLRKAVTAGDSKRAAEYKNRLPAYTMSGTFTVRRGDALVAHSGHVVLDFDDVDTADTKAALAQSPHTMAAWVSPSGTGVKALIPVDPVPTNADEHVDAWKTAAAAYAHIDGLDKSGKDVNRLCYKSWDPEIHITAEATAVKWTPETAVDLADDPVDDIADDVNPDVDAALALKPASSFSHDDWLHIGMALNDGGHPFEMWDEWSALDTKRYPGTSELRSRWNGFRSGGGISMGTFWKLMGVSTKSLRIQISHSDAWIAETAIMTMAPQLLYVHDKDNDDGGSLRIDDGTGIWTDDPGSVNASYLQVWRGYYNSETKRIRSTVADEKQQKDDLKKLGALARKATDARSFARLRTFAPAVILDRAQAGIGTKQLTTAQSGNLDTDLRYIGCANGVIDLHEGRLLPSDEGRKALVTRPGSPFEFDASIDPESDPHPLIQQLFTGVSSEAREWLFESLGHALRGKPNRRLIMLQGPGNSGKTTLMETVAEVLGDTMYTWMKSATAENKPVASAGLSPEVEVFTKTRIAYLDEGSADRIDSSIIKQITGGGSMAYRGLRRDPTEGVATATPIIAGNDVLPADYDDHALVDRICVVPFDSLPEEMKDVGMKDKLLSECGDELLTRLVHAAARNPEPPQKNDVINDAMDSVMERQANSSDITLLHRKTWLDAHIVRDDESKLSTDLLWEAVKAHNPEETPDYKRAPWMDTARKTYGLPITSQYRENGKQVRGWKGYRLQTCDKCAHLEEANDGE